MGNTVMIVGLGDLGGWVLEFLARCEGVSTIITADLREDWGIRKTDTVAIGAAQQGYNKTMKFYKCDVRDIDRTAELLKTINPDLVYSDVALSSWVVQSELVSKVSLSSPDIVEKWPKVAGARAPLQVVLVSKLMQAIKKSGITAHVLNNSFRSVNSFDQTVNLRTTRHDKGGDRLYQNVDNKFVDVSEEAGIYGSEIAFGSNHDQIVTVWKMSLESRKPIQFSETRLSGYSFSLTWSPGEKILYHKGNHRNFFILDPQTGEEDLLMEDESLGWIFTPKYSPDGREIAVHWDRNPSR